MVFMVNKLTAVTNHFDELFRAAAEKKTTDELMTQAESLSIVARDQYAPLEIRTHADKLYTMIHAELMIRANRGEADAKLYLDILK